MNGLDLFRGRIKVTPAIASHSPFNISETVRDRGFVSKDHTNRKWHMGYQMVTWSMTARDPKGAVRQYVQSAILATALTCSISHP